MTPHDVKEICKKIEDYRKRDVKEAATKTGLIEPVFRQVGWDFSDIDSVEPEYPVLLGQENNPADYALRIDGKVSLLVEAKRINEKLDTAIADGTAKASTESVPWLIATNGDAFALLRIDAQIPADERTVFQVVLSASVANPDLTERCITCLEMLRPDRIREGVLRAFADRKLKQTRVWNVVEAALSGSAFEQLLQDGHKEKYSGDVPDQEILAAIVSRLREGIQALRGEEDWDPSAVAAGVTIDPNAPELQARRLKLFRYPGKGERASVARNITDRRELWLEFLRRSRMSTPEFKDHARFVKQGVAGFSYFLTYYGLATNDGKDKIRGGIFLKLNEAVVDDIKSVLGIR